MCLLGVLGPAGLGRVLGREGPFRSETATLLYTVHLLCNDCRSPRALVIRVVGDWATTY